MTPQETLFKAADIIEERGHAKGYYATNDGRVCAIGAMRLATGGKITPFRGGVTVSNYDFVDVSEGIRVMGKYLRDHAEDYGYSVFSDAVHRWNDDPNTTAEQVIDVMRKAAGHA